MNLFGALCTEPELWQPLLDSERALQALICEALRCFHGSTDSQVGEPADALLSPL